MNPGGVRSQQGRIPVKTLEDHGLTIVMIRQWRELESDAGRPSGLADFYAAHGLCMDCGNYGAQMIGWSSPQTPEEVENARELGLEELPLYEVCPTCKGTGGAERSQWQGSITPRTHGT